MSIEHGIVMSASSILIARTVPADASSASVASAYGMGGMGKIFPPPGNPRRLWRKRSQKHNSRLLKTQRHNHGTMSAQPSVGQVGHVWRIPHDLPDHLMTDGVAFMGIFGALTTAVSGLNAQSFSLENISGNIANSRTTGFKRVDTSFATLVPDMPSQREIAGSVGAYSRATTTVQGDFVSSQITTNMAISGEGFFAVKQRTSLVDGAPVFSGANAYTRRGDFQIDKNGYLVNGSGFYLQGFMVDPTTGSATGSALQVLRIDNDNLAAKPSVNVEYRANLPRYPMTSNADATAAGSELLSGAAYTGATVAASDDAGFVARTISGQALTVYNASGTPMNVQMRWGKTSNTSGAETWSLYYMSDSAATGAATKWTRMSNTVTFDANGKMTSPASGILSQTFTINGATSGAVDINFGTTGLTQYADSNGTIQVNRLTQDGYPSGTLSNVELGDGGRIMGVYSNGQTVGIAQVPIAQFQADNMLKRKDGGVFQETLESGQPLIVDAGRSLLGGTLENSNADIADEFSKMIVTQQAYSANTRIITTAQQMLQDVINIVR